jgi:hypothetical protein
MAKRQSPQPAPAAPSQLKGFFLGIVAAAIVVALVLAVLRWRDPEPTAAAPLATAPVPQPMQPQGPPPAPMFPPMAMASAPRISVPEAKALADRGEAVFIDVRDVRSFEAGHIPGALQIPLDYVQGEIPWFPEDRLLIPYCT